METKVQVHSQNFEMLQHAFAHGRVALLEVQDRSTGESRAAIVAVNVDPETGEHEFVPFALMIDGNPYEQLNPPDPDGGFHASAWPAGLPIVPKIVAMALGVYDPFTDRAPLPDAALHARVLARVREARDMIQSHIGGYVPLPEVSYFTDNPAAQAATSWDLRSLAINRDALEAYPDEMLSEVIPHEMAHVAHGLMAERGLAKPQIPNDHTAEWRRVSREIFGREFDVHSDYALLAWNEARRA